MAEVIIALGSNLNNPLLQLRQAKVFLQQLSEKKAAFSPIYKSAAVGPGKFDYLNAVASVTTGLSPTELILRLQQQEIKQGRPPNHKKWIDRTLDLDIIAYNNLVVGTDSLIIPHSLYTQRLFVLLPLKDVFPNWVDPESAQHIDRLIETAPELKISKTKLSW